jgi:ribosome-associated toxin RatA of RatAB toxin-antitoxin module
MVNLHGFLQQHVAKCRPLRSVCQRVFTRFISACLISFVLLIWPVHAASVHVQQVQRGDVPGVISSINLPYPADTVWSVINNPQQLTQRAPNVKRVKLVANQGKTQDLAYSVKITPLLPQFDYVLRYQQTGPYTLSFSRVSGSFKSIKGYWKVLPQTGGKTSTLVYALNLDPGFAAPKPLIGQAIKMDVPHLLQHARNQVALFALTKSPTVASNRR